MDEEAVGGGGREGARTELHLFISIIVSPGFTIRRHRATVWFIGAVQEGREGCEMVSGPHQESPASNRVGGIDPPPPPPLPLLRRSF
jgi:hypothetical protein